MILVKPFDGDYRITQAFGANPQDYARFGLAGHDGIDYALPMGTMVKASVDGVLTFMSDPESFGNFAEILATGGTYRVIHAHLDSFVGVNERSVKVGEIIGRSGDTGNSTGPHLHLGVQALRHISGDPMKGYRNPMDFMQTVPITRVLEMEALLQTGHDLHTQQLNELLTVIHRQQIEWRQKVELPLVAIRKRNS